MPAERWAELIQHLEQVLAGQSALVPLPGDLEGLAQRLAAQLVRAQAQSLAPGAQEPDYQAVDLNSLARLAPAPRGGGARGARLACMRLSSTPSLPRGDSMRGRCRRRWG